MIWNRATPGPEEAGRTRSTYTGPTLPITGWVTVKEAPLKCGTPSTGHSRIRSKAVRKAPRMVLRGFSWQLVRVTTISNPSSDTSVKTLFR